MQGRRRKPYFKGTCRSLDAPKKIEKVVCRGGAEAGKAREKKKGSAWESLGFLFPGRGWGENGAADM